MITIQKIGKLLMMFLIVAGMASCNDDETEPFTAYGEVLTIKKLVNDTVNYARAYYVYGNYPMSSATVTLPEGGTMDLTSYESNKQTYYEEPAAADYSKDAPEFGDFSFTVVNEGIEHTLAETTEMGTLEITEVTVTTGSGIITVKWDKVTDADNYVVRLKDDEGAIAFVGTSLSNSAVTFQIAAGTGTFAQQLVSGDTYTLELQAIQYESTATASDYWHNIEEISIASQDFVWE